MLLICSPDVSRSGPMMCLGQDIRCLQYCHNMKFFCTLVLFTIPCTIHILSLRALPSYPLKATRPKARPVFDWASEPQIAFKSVHVKGMSSCMWA